MIPVFMALALAAQDTPNRSYLDVTAWFRSHLKDFDSAKIEQIKPPSRGVWKTGVGGIFTTALIPRREEHLAVFHCYRVSAPATPLRRFLLVEGPDGTVIASRMSGHALEQHCG